MILVLFFSSSTMFLFITEKVKAESSTVVYVNPPMHACEKCGKVLAQPTELIMHACIGSFLLRHVCDSKAL